VREAKLSGTEDVEFGTVDEALGALRVSDVSALVIELPDALRARTRDPQLEIGVFLGGRRSRVYVVNKGDRALRERLDSFLRSLRLTASWPSMVVRHYGASTFEILARAHLTD
jgi:hypothetical protein